MSIGRQDRREEETILSAIPNGNLLTWFALGGVHGPGLPNITGEFTKDVAYANLTTSGVFQSTLSNTYGMSNSSQYVDTRGFDISIDASRASKAYGSGGSHDVRPCAYGTLVCVFLGN